MEKHTLRKFITKLQRCFQNRSSYEFRNIYRKTPVLESFINKAAGLKDCNFIKKDSNTVNIGKFLRTASFAEYIG